ncbi:tyrosine-protein phosphatase [Tenggerimyces flavus]|uniref:Tyrosine-protein phosphatase n=1 Tax=Tenggerimyces flavus TaxID=1708749 RepID=A0ABV7Y8H2_9ACTN|nr:tyrosine-protein phosphatase [Tenggerimyces flavus]MBM7785397.1 protein tyrosine/serine phosphatase [Tenggerimyces flavus]
MIDWPGCRNVRDLGTIPGVHSGALIRSDSLTELTAAGVEAVRAAKPSRIVDLRTHRELRALPNPFADDAAYVHRSLYPDPPPPREDLTPVQQYSWLLDYSIERFAQAVAAIADAPAGGLVVVHCAGGVDRTGLVIAVTLSSIGINRDEVVADYLRSDDVEASTLTGALEHVDARYGDVQKYLAHGGMSSGQAAKLRERLVLGPPAG